MRRLWGAVIVMGCTDFTSEVIKDRDEALRKAQAVEEGVQSDGSYVACAHLSQLARESRNIKSLIEVARFHASSGFFENRGMDTNIRTLGSGYEDFTSREWACARFKGMEYVYHP